MNSKLISHTFCFWVQLSAITVKDTRLISWKLPINLLSVLNQKNMTAFLVELDSKNIWPPWKKPRYFDVFHWMWSYISFTLRHIHKWDYNVFTTIKSRICFYFFHSTPTPEKFSSSSSNSHSRTICGEGNLIICISRYKKFQISGVVVSQMFTVVIIFEIRASEIVDCHLFWKHFHHFGVDHCIASAASCWDLEWYHLEQVFSAQLINSVFPQ